MNQHSGYSTAQEKFWFGEFGDHYIDRNQSDALLAANLDFFVRSIKMAGAISSVIEFGANVGMNMRALSALYPGIEMAAIEINERAASVLADVIGEANVFRGSILDYVPKVTHDLAFTKTVLIHIHPDHLSRVYQNIYDATAKYILLGEYYSPSPVSITYRGHTDRLYKRDFAGEMLEAFDDLRLVDYGFCYHRDAVYPQDDISWFLMEKAGQ